MPILLDAVLFNNDWKPTATLLEVVVFAPKALKPIATLLFPVVLESND